MGSDACMNQVQQASLLLLQKDLRKHARLNDYFRAVRTFNSTKAISAMPLDSVPTDVRTPAGIDPKAAALEAAGRDRIILNGVTFNGTAKISLDADPMKYSSFLRCLEELCRALCDLAATNDVNHEVMFDNIVARISRKLSSTDSYSKLNSVLAGSNDFTVMPAKVGVGIKTPKGANARRWVREDSAAYGGPSCSPVDIRLYVEGGMIHGTFCSMAKYGLYRREDIKASSYLGHKPWVGLDATTHERVNFSTGESVRYVATRAGQ